MKSKFEQTKAALFQFMTDGLAYYDKSQPTVFVTHLPKEGIGVVVKQQYCSCVSQETHFAVLEGGH